MAESENVKIYECSTNLVLGGDAANWFSKGYGEGWAFKTYDPEDKYKLPYPIDKAYYTDKVLNISTLQEGVCPCVIGRVIEIDGHPIWSVVVFVAYGKDNKGGRGVPVYRLFFCEGNNLQLILNLVYTYEQVNNKLPFFDPFMTYGCLNDYQISTISLDGLIYQEDAALATSELDRKLLVLPKGTFDVEGGLNALSLLKLNLLTRQRAIAQAKELKQNVTADKITKIAWAYNADRVLEKAESYGLIQAYDDFAYQALIKKSGNKIKQTPPKLEPKKTKTINGSRNLDVGDKPWDFLSILKDHVATWEFRDGFDAKPITDSFARLVRHRDITSADVELNKDILFRYQKEQEAIEGENSLYTFVKIAKQDGLDNFAFQRGDNIQAIRLYILICILFPVNIEQQQKDINKFRKQGSQSDIDFFIDKLRASSTSSPESSLKIIERGFKDIFSEQENNIEQVVENVKWLWIASPWSHLDLLKDVGKFFQTQILLIEANKYQEVSTYLQFLCSLNNDLREKTKLLRDVEKRFLDAIKPYQFDWAFWEIDNIKSWKTYYSNCDNYITQNCTTEGSLECTSLVLLLKRLCETDKSINGTYHFFDKLSNNGQPKLLDYQPDPSKDISKWIIDKTYLLNIIQNNTRKSSLNYTYARILVAISWIFIVIPFPVWLLLVAFGKLAKGTIRFIRKISNSVFFSKNTPTFSSPNPASRSKQPLLSQTHHLPASKPNRGDRITLNIFKFVLAVLVASLGIVGWITIKEIAINKVVKKLPEIDQSFTQALNNKSNKFFERYQLTKPNKCDIITAKPEELSYSGCNLVFDNKAEEQTKRKVAIILLDQGFISWNLNLFGDEKIKINYNITPEKIIDSFNKKYQETPYPSLIAKLESEKYFDDNKSGTELTEAYTKDLNYGKYKYYDLVTIDKIASHLYVVLGIEGKKYRDKEELVKAIYRYQVKDNNLFVDGKVPKGAVTEQDPRDPSKTIVKAPENDTYESIKLKLRRNLNQDLRAKIDSDRRLKADFEALRKKAEAGFTRNANAESGKDPTANTTQAALKKMVDSLSNQELYDCKQTTEQIREAIVAELTSASPKQDKTSSINLRDALEIPSSSSRDSLIDAIFDYQVGKLIKENEKEVVSGWDGTINPDPDGGVFKNVMKNVSKQLGCQKKK